MGNWQNTILGNLINIVVQLQSVFKFSLELNLMHLPFIKFQTAQLNKYKIYTEKCF